MDVSFIGHAGIQYRNPDSITGDAGLPACAGPCQVRSDSARRGAQAALDLVVERDSSDTRVACQVLQRALRGPCRHYRKISEGPIRDRAGGADILSAFQSPRLFIRSFAGEAGAYAACFFFHELDQDANRLVVRKSACPERRYGGFHLLRHVEGGLRLLAAGTRGLTVQAD